MDAANGLPENRGDAHLDKVDPLALIVRNAVGGHKFLEWRLAQPLEAEIPEHRVGDHRIDIARTGVLEKGGGGDQGPGGLGEVVHKNHVGVLDLADKIERLDLGGRLTAFGHDRKAGAE